MTNPAWREADAEAHEAKAEALELSIVTLRGVLPILDNIGKGAVASALGALETEATRHEEAAALLRGVAAA